MFRISFFATLLSLLMSCGETNSSRRSETTNVIDSLERTADFNPQRNAYFGDLHVHSMYSYDAFIFGGIASPNDAYEFAKGAPIRHPAGFDMQLDTPLDFYGVSDHAYYLGIIREMANGESALSAHPVAEGIDSLSSDVLFRRSVFLRFANFANTGNGSEVMDEQVVKNAWDDIVSSANRHYEPGKFTTFIAYEYTGTGPENEMLHRNVIFKGSVAPEIPFSRIDSDDPRDLWSWMDTNRANGVESLAIPHNSNLSNGLMFALVDYQGRPLDAVYANQRIRNEPLVEITQVKGTSETHPALSMNDELAGFELQPFSVGGSVPIQPQGSYVRKALLDGIELQADQGFNPFKVGVIGSSDTHNATHVGSEENFYGVSGLLDSNAQNRGSLPLETNEEGEDLYFDRYAKFGASGLAGVWAEQNTRDSIYDALRRKETFGTSGPRIKIRFFAGHDLPAINERELVKKSYESGVSMGGNYIANTDQRATFIAWAAKDPNSAPLQRLQIIKGWVQDNQIHEQIYDVACADNMEMNPSNNRCTDNGAVVNLEDCSISSDLGSTELKTRWTDPDYDPTQHAFYYVRVIENPTCRWSTWDAVRAGIEPRSDLPPTIQERGWSSPIWVIPTI